MVTPAITETKSFEASIIDLPRKKTWLVNDSLMNCVIQGDQTKLV
jgi:hypothetical protein